MSPLRSRAATAEYPGLLCPPRALPTVGETSKVSSEGVTPPSQLIRAHAPDQNPPRASASALCAGSLQVAASPCWEMALPDIISATLVQALGPIPRRAPRLRSSIPSPRTPAFTHGKMVGRTDLSPRQLLRGADIGAAVIRSPSGSCTRSAPRLLRPRRSRAGPPGLSHHASPGRLPEPGCGVASRSTWTTDVAGLSPAGPQPCRLLLPGIRLKQALLAGRRAEVPGRCIRRV
jgi:hypothetical protein